MRVLRGFQKVSVDAGMSTLVTFDLMRRDISYWDVVAQNWRIPAGDMTVSVGLSSRDLQVNWDGDCSAGRQERICEADMMGLYAVTGNDW